MIAYKKEAMQELAKDYIDFEKIDKSLLRDKDVILAYMQHHSSNNIIVKKCPIDIEVKGMVDDVDFVLDVIKNLDACYNKSALMALLKYSAFCIVRAKFDKNDALCAYDLKCFVSQILTKYNDMVKVRNSELSKKQSILDELNNFINEAKLDAFDTKEIKNTLGERYKRSSIGFDIKI